MKVNNSPVHLKDGSISKFAIGSAIFAIPLAGLDVFFFRQVLAQLLDLPENGMYAWLFSVFLSVGALVLASIAAVSFTQHGEKKVFRILGKGLCSLVWLVIGLGSFVVRLFENIAEDDFSIKTNLPEAILFLVVFIADGVLAFIAAAEIFERARMDYAKADKKVKSREQACSDLLTTISDQETRLNNCKKQELAGFRQPYIDAVGKMSLLKNDYSNQVELMLAAFQLLNGRERVFEPDKRIMEFDKEKKDRYLRYIECKVEAANLGTECTALLKEIKKQKELLDEPKVALDVLDEAIITLYKGYYKTTVPSRMKIAIRKFRDADLFAGSDNEFWKAIEFDPETKKPLSENDYFNKTLFDF
jgi:uncharacterized membrane protein YciS (DUF1049 family)